MADNISINMGIDVFRKNIIETVKLSQLPVGIVYYVFKDMLVELEESYNSVLQKEHNEILAKLEQEEREREDVKEHQE